MNVLIVFAHPEPASLNGQLKNDAVRYLQKSDHQVEVSDLYRMAWKTSLDAGDTPAPPRAEPPQRRAAPRRGAQARRYLLTLRPEILPGIFYTIPASINSVP